MNRVPPFLVIAGTVLLIGAGLIGLIYDLLGRGPHASPLIEDDGIRWPPRYQGVAPQQHSAAERARLDVNALPGRRH